MHGNTNAATPILTAEELAERWRVTPKWVLNHARNVRDPIPCYRLGRYIRFEDSAPLREWFERRRANGR